MTRTTVRIVSGLVLGAVVFCAGIAAAQMQPGAPPDGGTAAAPPPSPSATPAAGPETGDARYTFLRSGDGFMRLDNSNGEVALCARQTVGWACQMLPEDRAALESEIARLQRQSAALRQALVARGIALPDGEPNPPPPAARDDRNPRMPDANDFARMKSLACDAWRRLVDMIARLSADALGKS